MTRYRSVLVCVALAACAGEEDPGPAEDPGTEMTGLDLCIAEGGALSPVTEIDNNVLVAHGEITAMAFAATGQMALASTDGAIKLWSLREQAEGTIDPEVGYDAAFGSDNPPIRALAYSPDGSWIASGRESGEVAAWDPATGS